MPVKDIQKILREGSFKQKVKLYFTDIALFNLSYSTEKTILTDKERQIIVDSLKAPKELEYYNNLRTYNKAFLLYKPHITSYKNLFKESLALIDKNITVWTIYGVVNEAINDVLDAIRNKKDRAEAHKILIENLGFLGVKSYQEPGLETYVDFPNFLPIAENSDNLKTFEDVLPLIIDKLNTDVKYFKEILFSVRKFLKVCLPLEPYINYVDTEEEEIINIIKTANYKLKIYNLVAEDKSLNVTLWEDVPVAISEEYIEAIKSSGL